MPDTLRSSASHEPAPEGRRPIDSVALARIVHRLQQADAPPWLHGEVARRMAERLPIIKLQPHSLIDWGSFLGASHDRLGHAYPQARQVLVEGDAARQLATSASLQQPWWSPRRWAAAAPAVLLEDDVAAGQAQLLWSNMLLQRAADPQAVMRQWQRALAVDGFLMFSTLGPGSLTTLQALYAAQGWKVPFAPFVDMHDLGDMLVEAGFADPVMDQETITLTWASPTAALKELRALGGNADPRRNAGLRTPRWRQALLGALAAQCSDRQGRVALEFELVYGHAFKAAPRPRLAAQTVLPLEDMRAMVRAGRAPR